MRADEELRQFLDNEAVRQDYSTVLYTVYVLVLNCGTISLSSHPSMCGSEIAIVLCVSE